MNAVTAGHLGTSLDQQPGTVASGALQFAPKPTKAKGRARRPVRTAAHSGSVSRTPPLDRIRGPDSPTPSKRPPALTGRLLRATKNANREHDTRRTAPEGKNDGDPRESERSVVRAPRLRATTPGLPIACNARSRLLPQRATGCRNGQCRYKTSMLTRQKISGPLGSVACAPAVACGRTPISAARKRVRG